jgi:hypothetical protein
LGGNVARFGAKEKVMDGNLVQSVNPSLYSLEQMAKAKVPNDLAQWYHNVGRNLGRVGESDVRKLMQVRLAVLASNAPASWPALRAAA